MIRWRTAVGCLMVGCVLGGTAAAQRAPLPEDEPRDAEPKASVPHGPVTYSVRDGELVLGLPDGPEVRIALGCHGTDVVVHHGRAHVACGEAGVAIVDLADPTRPQHLGRAPAPGKVRSVFVRHDQVWMEVASVAARPVGAPRMEGEGSPAASAPRTAPPSRRSRPPEGEVLEAHSGEVVVSLGTEHDLAIGSDVELYHVETETLGGRRVSQQHTAAIGKVQSVSEDRARVELGFGEKVDAGAHARPTRRPPTASRVAPPRQGGLFEIQAFARPFLPLGEVGFGVLGDASLTYRGRKHWFLRAQMDPVGFGVGGAGTVGAFAGAALAGYDHPLFGVGLGVGAMRINHVVSDISGRQLGLTMAQTARFGAIDGLRFELTNTFVVVDVTGAGGENELRWGSILASAQFPITDGGWLIARGGGGRPGHIFMDAGLRWAVTGDGGHGTVFLMPTIGWVWLRQRVGSADGAERAGPSVGLGVEWRP